MYSFESDLREKPLLGRALKPEEAREVRDIARRIAAILLLEPALDAGYGAVKGEASVAGERATKGMET